MIKKRALIGAGRFAEEVKWHIESGLGTEKSFSEAARLYMGGKDMICFVDDKYWLRDYPHIYKLSTFNPLEYDVLIAVGDPKVRENLKNKLPEETTFFSYIHPSAQILDKDGVKIGEGSYIGANCVLTTNINIGDHCQLNIGTVIGHDCRIGDFFTTAPGAKISGDCQMGDCVYLGTNSSVKEKIVIFSDVTIGMGAAVVKDIYCSGTYVGVPAEILKE
jgi:sugar O-acyltransferase (sialic acid O-acetyltransferase NeuD family)